MTEHKMSLRDTIIPKSDQLNYDDVMAGTITVKVTGMKQGSNEQPVILKVSDADNGQPMRDYKPCKGMRRVLVAAWGDKGAMWIGQSARLYGNPAVKWGGEKVGGIEISHVTGITEPLVVMLTVSRGKRREHVVKPLAEPEMPQ